MSQDKPEYPDTELRECTTYSVYRPRGERHRG